MEIKICIDMDIYDVALLLQASRIAKLPVDALLKKAVAEYVEKIISPPPQEQQGGR